MVAGFLGLETNEVLDNVVDSLDQCELLKGVTSAGGRGTVMFYMQDGEPPGLSKLIKSLESTENYFFNFVFEYLFLIYFQ